MCDFHEKRGQKVEKIESLTFKLVGKTQIVQKNEFFSIFRSYQIGYFLQCKHAIPVICALIDKIYSLHTVYKCVLQCPFVTAWYFETSQISRSHFLDTDGRFKGGVAGTQETPLWERSIFFNFQNASPRQRCGYFL